MNVARDPAAGEAPSIMLVDDDRMLRMLGESVLGEGGFRVTALASGEEALERLREIAPELILLDIMMPGIDGFETCRRIKSDPLFAQVPVIMLTGADDVDSVRRAYGLGAWEFNPKPINWPILVNRCRHALDAHRAFAQARKAARLASVLDNAQNEILEIDGDTLLITDINQSGRVRLGRGAGRLEAVAATDLLVGFDTERLRALVEPLDDARPQVPLIAELRRLDGSTYPVEGLVLRVPDEDGRCTYCAILRDVSDRLDHQKQLFRLQFYDHLTGLPNSLLFSQKLVEEMRSVERGANLLAVAILDLDGLKTANDALGYSIGDEIIRTVADRLGEVARISERSGPDGAGMELLVARRGGDEFLLMVVAPNAHISVRIIAQQMLAAVQKPMSISGHEMAVTASMGIALYPRDGSDPELLQRSAEAAMYAAKAAGGNVFRFSNLVDSQLSLEKLTIETQLRKALEKDELEVHYQIQVDDRDRSVRGVEALVRWRHPERGLLAPGIFLPIAEETSLIVELGYWVMQRVFTDSRTWLRECLPADAKISINVSAKQLHQETFMDDLKALKADLPPAHQIVFELTETAIVEDLEFQHHFLGAIRDIGFEIAIDDFGTGYSSLQYLKNLPLDYLKVDRSFVSAIDLTETDLQLVKVIFALAKTMGLRVVAEGVETESQLSLLSECGPHIAQGFLFSPAVARDRLESLMPVTARAEG
ncbi:MAG TPA: EAL domain-containing protein [Pseudomonadales bacterium]|nr:EAL domain-containing protein [Pseudomonadales bacterium]